MTNRRLLREYLRAKMMEDHSRRRWMACIPLPVPHSKQHIYDDRISHDIQRYPRLRVKRFQFMTKGIRTTTTKKFSFVDRASGQTEWVEPSFSEFSLGWAGWVRLMIFVLHANVCKVIKSQMCTHFIYFLSRWSSPRVTQSITDKILAKEDNVTVSISN